MPKAKFDIVRKCNICGQPFHAKTLTSIHCSRRCTNEAYRRKKREQHQRIEQSMHASIIPDSREFLSVSEAAKIFAVSRNTLYRHIKSGVIEAINPGVRLTRLKRSSLEVIFQSNMVPDCSTETDKQTEVDISRTQCYTLQEIYTRYHVSPSTVYKAIRVNKIPTKQMGRYLLVEKKSVDKLFS